MPLFSVRVWLPDRPGALGAVASRIGAVRGDLVGIDILERGGGRAVDELVVELPSETLVELLVNEINEVDGVDVEDVRRAGDALADPRLDALEAAVALVSQRAVQPLLGCLVRASRRDFEAEWAAVLDPEAHRLVASVGPVPAAEWLEAFISGTRSCLQPPVTDDGGEGETGAAPDVAWADLDGAGLAVVLGRSGRPFRARERRQLAALTRIADARCVELALPSGAGARG